MTRKDWIDGLLVMAMLFGLVAAAQLVAWALGYG